MIMKQSRKRVAEEREALNEEMLQYHEMYNLFNKKGHLGQLFSCQEKCRCLVCKKSINDRCTKRHTVYYLKTTTITKKVKIFHLGQSLFKCAKAVTRCRELCKVNPLALECFLVPRQEPKLY